MRQYRVVVSQQCHRIASFLRLVLTQISGTVFHRYLGNAVLGGESVGKKQDEEENKLKKVQKLADGSIGFESKGLYEKRMQKFVSFVVAVSLFYIIGGWKIPILWRMESLKLPEGCKTVYHTKIQISDVYWLHTRADKVIRCEMDYESAKTYIEEHNSEKALEHIAVYFPSTGLKPPPLGGQALAVLQ